MHARIRRPLGQAAVLEQEIIGKVTDLTGVEKSIFLSEFGGRIHTRGDVDRELVGVGPALDEVGQVGEEQEHCTSFHPAHNYTT